MREVGTVPLTLGQRVHLIRLCLPLVTFGLVVVAYLLVAQPWFGIETPLGLLAVVVAVLLFLGRRAWQAARDLRLGVALVVEDELDVSRCGSNPVSASYGCHFAELGRLRMRPAAYYRSIRGRWHRVVYSPASKLVWEAAPIWTRRPLGPAAP